MSDTITLKVNGKAVSVPAGAMVPAAINLAGKSTFRRSVTGEPRGALCGMGVCGECRATIDGRAHRRSCQTRCRADMEVEVDA